MTLKVAVIGVGAMGRNHARLYWELAGVDFVGLADRDEKAAQGIAGRYHTKAYTDYRKLLDEQKPDAVTVAVPTAEHVAVALEVIQRGVHVLIEKPIALTLAEGQKIIAAAEKQNVRLMVGHIERFNPAVEMLKRSIDEGKCGRIFQMDAHRQGPFPARIGDVGVVIDLAVHDVDVMRYLTGSEVERVYAETEQRIHTEHEDLLIGLLRFSDRTVGSLTINWLTPTKIRELFVTGELGMYRVDYLTQDLYFYENAGAKGADWDSMRVLRGVSEGQMVRFAVAKKEPLRAEQEAFLAAVRGERPVAVSGQDGLKALEIAQAVVRSGSGHQSISLEGKS